MTAFWWFAALLLLLGLVFVVLPLFSHKNKKTSASRLDINRSIYENKVDELQADLEKNLLDQDEYENALADLQLILLQDAENDSEQEFITSNNIIVILLLTIALPLATFFVYKQVSTYKTEAEVAKLQSAPSQVQSMQNAIASLQQKLQDDPENVDGWKMLGQSYFVVQQYNDAKNAYIKAAELVNQADPDILILLAESSAFANDELFGEYERSLINKALAINPRHERGLWYAGYSAYSINNYSEAAKQWGVLLGLVPEDRPEVKETLLKFLNDARAKAGQPEVEQKSIAKTVEANQRIIKASVQLSKDVNEKAESNDTLFIYARAVEGPKMPLSLARLTVANLPVTVNLTKEMAMMPSMNIDTFDKVEVLARISKSGQAISQPGDLISKGVVVDFTKSSSAEVNLEVNSIVE